MVLNAYLLRWKRARPLCDFCKSYQRRAKKIEFEKKIFLVEIPLELQTKLCTILAVVSTKLTQQQSTTTKEAKEKKKTRINLLARWSLIWICARTPQWPTDQFVRGKPNTQISCRCAVKVNEWCRADVCTGWTTQGKQSRINENQFNSKCCVTSFCICLNRVICGVRDTIDIEKDIPKNSKIDFPMETAWRFRIMLFMAFAIIIFGDMLGYGNVKSDRNSNGNHQNRRQAVDATSSSATLKNQHRPNIDLNDGEPFICATHVRFFIAVFFISVCCAIVFARSSNTFDWNTAKLRNEKLFQFLCFFSIVLP